MTASIRVLHQLDTKSPTDAVVSYAEQLRDTVGVEEAEAYAALDDGHLALVETWKSQGGYSEHWARSIAHPAENWLLGRIQNHAAEVRPSEFYMLEPFLGGSAWTASALADSTPAIVWPARGGVRVVCQIGMTDSAELRSGLIADQELTRREPGCLQYQWFQSLDVKEYFLLLELWENQSIYDKHWQLRNKTGSASGEMPIVERRRGTSGVEFYRHQPFVHLYDRWLPTDADAWSETVAWPH